MPLLSVTALFAVHSIAYFLELGLAVARIAGLPVSSWRAGDPTRTCFQFLAEVLATLDSQIAEYIKAGFLSTAEGQWLRILAWEVYGVEVEEATYATPPVTIENEEGGFYELAAGDLTVKATLSGKTYRNTSPGTLSGGATVTFELIADESGSGSNVGVDEIDSFVTTLPGCKIVSSTAAVARDEPSDEEIREQCLASLGALSPNGPADAYDYVVRSSELTGVSDITRSRSVSASLSGEVTVYVANATGAPAGASITAAQAAVERHANPLCATPTVVAGTAVPIAVTAVAYGELPADFAAVLTEAITALLGGIDISAGETSDMVATDEIIGAAHGAISRPGMRRFAMTVPAANTVLSVGQFPTLGAVSITNGGA